MYQDNCYSRCVPMEYICLNHQACCTGHYFAPCVLLVLSLSEIRSIITVIWGKITYGDRFYLGYFPIITGVLKMDYYAVIIVPASCKWENPMQQPAA